MAWSLVSKGAVAALSAGAGGTSLSVPLPASLAANNLLVFGMGIATSSGADPASITAPSGWTQVVYYNDQGVMGIGVWYKIASGSESGNQVWSWTGSYFASGAIDQWSGNATVSPTDGSATGDNGNTTSFTSTGADLLYLVGSGWFGATGPSAPTGYTLDWNATFTGNMAAVAASAHLIQSAGGATGAQGIAWTNDGGFRTNALVAFKPGAGVSDPFPAGYEMTPHLLQHAVYRM